MLHEYSYAKFWNEIKNWFFLKKNLDSFFWLWICRRVGLSNLWFYCIKVKLALIKHLFKSVPFWALEHFNLSSFEQLIVLIFNFGDLYIFTKIYETISQHTYTQLRVSYLDIFTGNSIQFILYIQGILWKGADH